MTSSNDIRATFLDYFARNGHEVVESLELWGGSVGEGA